MKKKIREYVPEIDPAPDCGLTAEQVQQRLDAGWDNQVSVSGLRSEKQIILEHCFTFFNIVFAVLAFILVLVRSSIANFGFLGVVLINLAIGAVQEIRAKRTVEKLTLVVTRKRRVLRDSRILEVGDEELVRDDVVLFSAGEQICADGVVRSGSLQMNEALVTGEPDLVEKQVGDELISGSFVVAGRAAVQLIRVGDDSYAAKLAAEARKNPRAGKSQMMRDLQRLMRFLSLILVPLGVLYFMTETASPLVDRKQAAEQTVAALVSMIPQGLYLLTSIALAVSSIRLSGRRVLVQDMSCIETLARVDVLCVDKTGTITEPGMQVEELVPLSAVDAEFLQQVLGSLFSGEPENETARALAELYKSEAPWATLSRVPFTSEQKWSGAHFSEGAFVVGAPGFVMGQRSQELESTILPWSEKGFRVLLLAGYEGDLKPGKLTPEKVTPLALLLLKTRIRETAFDTFRYFERQGVKIKVLSGDDPLAVADAAKRAGIKGTENYVNCEGLAEEALMAEADQCTVFGRVTPDQKRVIISALKERGHTVAMTGDGVNDVLAMRQAHCAVAMASGAQAASQVAQLVLLDSDFSGMPHIVAEGRRVVGNIRRAAALFLVKNIFTILVVLAALLTPLVYPFQPVTLTVINGLTVGLPSFVLAMEPNRERIRGKFLGSAMAQALPAGVAIFVTLVVSQFFGMNDTQLCTVSGVALAVVGLLTLMQISRPLTKLRKTVIVSAAVLLCAAFAVIGPVFAVELEGFYVIAMSILMSVLGAYLLVVFSLVRAQLQKRRASKRLKH